MKITFGPDITKDLLKAIEYEWLEKNTSGSYASSTIIGLNTRREHGLFVVQNSDLFTKIVLLSKLEESVFIENKIYEISTNQYSHTIFPHGYEYLEEFNLYPLPYFIYKVEDRIIHKKLFLVSEKNILVVRYELKNQGKPVKLIIKPFLAARYNHNLTDEVQGMNTDSYQGQNSVRWAPRPNLHHLYSFFNKGEYIANTLWYHKFFYLKDQERYTAFEEDLLNPGFFQVNLNPYDTFDLFFSTQNIPEFELDFERLHRNEYERRINKETETNRLREYFSTFNRNLKQSVTLVNKEIYIEVSTLQNNRNMRDILFSLPGLFLINHNYDDYKNVFKKIVALLNQGLLPVTYPSATTATPQYAAADLSLWLINFIYPFLVETNDYEFFDGEIYEALQSIIDYYEKGTLFNIYVDRDNLLFVGDRQLDLSWPSLRVNGDHSFRFGKLLEINALWYNAVCIMSSLSKKLQKNRYASKYAKKAGNIKKSFQKHFYHESGLYFVDFLQKERRSEAFHIHQLIPLALPCRCIDDRIAKNVLSRVEADLLTPYGLRITPKPNQEGSTGATQRFSVSYPWLLLFYIQACINYKSFSLEKLDYFKPLFDLSKKSLLGYIPEYIVENDPPYHAGMLDYSTALANLLWVGHILELTKQKTG